MSIFRNIIKWTMAITLIAIIIAAFINLVVVSRSAKRMITLEEAKDQGYDYVIVLGAGYRSNYQPSPMLKDRLDVGIEAFNDSQTVSLLLSGDSMDPSQHDEITVMTRYSISQGIAIEKITEDPFGLSTYESLWRAKYVHKAEKVLVITQKYHLYRAIYIGNRLGIDTYGIACDRHDYGNKMIWYTIREVIARCKDFFWCISQPEAQYSE